MINNIQQEQMIHSWVKLSGILKNTRITKGLMYNEAIVMLLVYNRYCEDGVGKISIKEITASTKMLKSLVNRTVNALIKKELLERCESDGDKRIVYVRCIEEKLNIFLEVHNASLKLAKNIVDIIGEEDAAAFIRLVDKIEKAGYSLK